jgi:hypothetical protein
MLEMDSNHCQIVSESLSQDRAVDERTFASLSVLAERLERLQELDSAFSAVGFSPDVEELQRRKNAVAIA